MQIKHIYWFCYYNIEEPSVRYRATYALQLLKQKHSITYTIVYPSYAWRNIVYFIWIFFRVLLFRKRDSIIVFQKIYRTGIYTTALKIVLFFHYKNTLYDTDDADYVRFPPQTIQYFMKHCAACSVGSQTLFEYAQQYNTNVFLWSSPVIKHNHTKIHKNSIFTIGWIGYFGAHQPNIIPLCLPAIKEISEYTPLKLVILGITHPEQQDFLTTYFKDCSVEIEAPYPINWLNETTVYQQIMQFDVGLAPLLDTEFNRAKSAFKLKQCLSCGIPVLASPIGENTRFLKENYNGYFCENVEDFKNKLLNIYHLNNTTYTQLSQQALDSYQVFSLDSYIQILLDFYQKKTIK